MQIRSLVPAVTLAVTLMLAPSAHSEECAPPRPHEARAGLTVEAGLLALHPFNAPAASAAMIGPRFAIGYAAPRFALLVDALAVKDGDGSSSYGSLGAGGRVFL